VHAGQSSEGKIGKKELLFLKKKNRAAGRQKNFCALPPGHV
jgi:hypothetical protein